VLERVKMEKVQPTTGERKKKKKEVILKRIRGKGRRAAREDDRKKRLTEKERARARPGKEKGVSKKGGGIKSTIFARHKKKNGQWKDIK